MNQFTKGSLYIVFGALLFSTKAIFVKIGYQEFNASTDLLIQMRMLFALPLFGFLAIVYLYKNFHKWKPIDFLKTLLVGFIGYFLASLFDFIGLKYISASIERVILFIYPTIVLLITKLFLKEPFKKQQVGSLLLAYLGIVIIFTSDFDLKVYPQFYLGAIYIILSALTYAIYVVGSQELLKKFSPMGFTSIAMSGGCIAVLVYTTIKSGPVTLEASNPELFLGITIAIISTFIPSLLISAGIKIIGANYAAIFGVLGPVATIVLAYAFLGERLTLQQLFGSAIIVTSITFLMLKKQ